jgi:Fe-S cluster biogenesis protein NfuA
MSHLQIVRDAPPTITANPTPNPASIKFQFSNVIAKDGCEFIKGGNTSRSPLAALLLQLAWVNRVYVGFNFVTVSAIEGFNWFDVTDSLILAFQDYVSKGRPILLPEDNEQIKSTDSKDVQTIKKVLNELIRPVVSRDGGDISFYRYENGRLELVLKGACAECPYSQKTLKNGIEVRMKAFLPHLIEVVSV